MADTDTTNATLPAPGAETPPASPNQQGTLAPGEGATVLPADLAEKIERASSAAVDQHLSASPKKSRGQRGPDKKPRKPRATNGVPLENLGNGTSEAHLEDATPAPLGGFVETEPAFDEETARQVLDIGLGLLNDGASAIVRAIAKKETGDEKLASEAADAVRMSEKIDAAVRTGGLLCAKKYAVRMEYAPEMMLGGGLVIWAGQILASVRALKAKGAELREREQQQEAA